MDARQPLSGDLKDIQRQHNKQVPQRSSISDSGSNTSSNNSSLLERRRSSRLQQGTAGDEESIGTISPMPTGAERMAALRDLGATFEEGQKSISKVATPTETIVPSFVDSDHLEQILHQKQHSKLSEVADKAQA